MLLPAGSHEKNLFYNKSAAFASVDNFNTLGPGTNWDTALHKNNLYHLRELCGVVGMNCLKSKFDLHPGKHYSLDSEELDEEQVRQINVANNKRRQPVKSYESYAFSNFGLDSSVLLSVCILYYYMHHDVGTAGDQHAAQPRARLGVLPSLREEEAQAPHPHALPLGVSGNILVKARSKQASKLI